MQTISVEYVFTVSLEANLLLTKAIRDAYIPARLNVPKWRDLLSE